MRLISGMVLAALLPAAGAAQDAVIRLEARRGDEAAFQAARDWSSRFDDVVMFPLKGDWVAIGLGPMPEAEARARLGQLRQAGAIPADSFVAPPAEGLRRVAATTPAGDDMPSPASDTAEPTAPGHDADTASDPGTLPDDVATGASAVAATAPADRPAAPVLAQGSHIRLAARRSRDEADEVLTSWRQTFPEAGLWQLPNGWFAVTLGPMEPTTARAWLGAFRAAGILPRDAFVSDAAELGRPVDPGKAPDLPPPGDVRDMPPPTEIQRALRWAGHYDGPIDGKIGPGTRAAITAEIVAQRLAPDAPTAMRRLMERRDAWRRQMGLTTLRDDHTALTVTAPMDRLAFDRAERALSIYGPRDDSGAALILFAQEGGQQELQDLAGLVTALGWVPNPERRITPGHVRLEGRNDTHLGLAEGWVRDGRAEGYVLIWPADDEENQRRIAAELSDSLRRTEPDVASRGAAAPAGQP